MDLTQIAEKITTFNELMSFFKIRKTRLRYEFNTDLHLLHSAENYTNLFADCDVIAS